jgi:hypothetical protein
MRMVEKTKLRTIMIEIKFQILTPISSNKCYSCHEFQTKKIIAIELKRQQKTIQPNPKLE